MMIRVGHSCLGNGVQDKKDGTSPRVPATTTISSGHSLPPLCPTLALPTSCVTLLPNCFTTILMYNTIDMLQKNAWITSSKI